jgi:hypothetical protein
MLLPAVVVLGSIFLLVIAVVVSLADVSLERVPAAVAVSEQSDGPMDASHPIANPSGVAFPEPRGG